jgi:hypothetical protein
MTKAKFVRFPWFNFFFLAVISGSMVGCQSNADPAQLTTLLTQAVDQTVKTSIPAQVKPAPAVSATPTLCTQNSPDIKLFVTVGNVSTQPPNVRFQSIRIEGEGFLPSEIVHLIIKVSGATHTFQMDSPTYTLTKEGSISDAESIQLDEPNMNGQVMIVHQGGVACASFKTQ